VASPRRRRACGRSRSARRRRRPRSPRANGRIRLRVAHPPRPPHQQRPRCLRTLVQVVLRSVPLAPRPRRSIACTARCCSRNGSRGRHREWSAGAPWTSTSGGPSPLVQYAISVPSLRHHAALDCFVDGHLTTLPSGLPGQYQTPTTSMGSYRQTSPLSAPSRPALHSRHPSGRLRSVRSESILCGPMGMYWIRHEPGQRHGRALRPDSGMVGRSAPTAAWSGAPPRQRHGRALRASTPPPSPTPRCRSGCPADGSRESARQSRRPGSGGSIGPGCGGSTTAARRTGRHGVGPRARGRSVHAPWSTGRGPARDRSAGSGPTPPAAPAAAA